MLIQKRVPTENSFSMAHENKSNSLFRTENIKIKLRFLEGKTRNISSVEGLLSVAEIFQQYSFSFA